MMNYAKIVDIHKNTGLFPILFLEEDYEPNAFFTFNSVRTREEEWKEYTGNQYISFLDIKEELLYDIIKERYKLIFVENINKYIKDTEKTIRGD